jgi:hypothetical protein
MRVVEIVTASTAAKYFDASPLVSRLPSTTTIEATMPLKTLTRTGVPNLSLMTPRNRGPAPS